MTEGYWIPSFFLYFICHSFILDSLPYEAETLTCWNTLTLSEILHLGPWTLCRWSQMVWEENIVYFPARFPVFHVPLRHICHRGVHWPCPPCYVPTPAHFKFVNLLGHASVPVFLCTEGHWALLRFLVSSQMVTVEVVVGKDKGSIFFQAHKYRNLA